MDREMQLKKLYFRAWHRGTREADMLIGGYFDHHSENWTSDDIIWFEKLLECDDVDVMAWAIGAQPVPAKFEGRQMNLMQNLNYIDLPGKDSF